MAGAHFAMLMGSAGGLVSPLPGGSVDSTQINPQNPNATWEFRTDGSVWSQVAGSSATLRHRWHNPGGNTALYVRIVHPGSGTAPSSGTLNTWLAMSSNRAFGLSRSTLGSSSGSVTIQFSADQSTVLSSGVYSYSATKETDL